MPKVWFPEPSNKSAVREALIAQRALAEPERARKYMFWEFTHWFLQGMRSIPWRDLGIPKSQPAGRTDYKGRRRVRFEKALVQNAIEVGRVMGIDIGPMVVRRPGLGIDSIRGESLSQATLSHVYDMWNSGQLKLSTVFHTVAYGMCGLLVHEPENDPSRWEPGCRIVPAWEMVPMPGNAESVDQVGGIMWSRKAPVDWLKSVLGKASVRKLMHSKWGVDELKTEYGTRIQGEFSPAQATMAMSVGNSWQSPLIREETGETDKNRQVNVDVHEVWLYNDDYSCWRYILQVGNGEPVLDLDYREDRWQTILQNGLPICPIHTPRYLEVGSFYGRGFPERQIPLNRELELLFADYVASMRERDRMTILMVPGGLGINTRNLGSVYRDRFMEVQPNPILEKMRPEVVGPPDNTSPLSKGIMDLATMMEGTSAQGPMLSGNTPGARSDSARQAAIIVEQQNVPLSVVGESMACAWTGVWKAVLGYVRFLQKHGERSDLSIRVSRLDEMSVGIVFDPDTRGVNLSQLELPDPRRLSVGIAAKNPRSKEVVASVIDRLYETQRITLSDFWILVLKEGLDVPCIDRTEYNHYQTAWLENVMLFGDGKTPGDPNLLKSNPMIENKVIHMFVHMMLMSDLVFRMADDSVQQMVVNHFMYHQGGQGSMANAQGVMGMNMDQMQMPPELQQLNGASMGRSAGNPRLTGQF